MAEVGYESVVGYVTCCYSALAGERGSLGQCYVQHDSLSVAFALCALFIVYSFVWSLVGRNCSKVDQLWSITPMVYAWHFYAHYQAVGQPRGHHDRLLLLCVLITVWGVRLTYNFWIKGGYGNLIIHEEDYRWPIIRSKMHPFLFWIVFNFSFIACYQNVLLLWIACPAFEVMRSAEVQLNNHDTILASLFLILWGMESLADLQHFSFQSLKHSLSAEQRQTHPSADVRRGFYSSGLFSLCRHPNYFAEQSMWLVVYLYSLSHNSMSIDVTEIVNRGVLNWTGLGCVQLILLFQGSMNFGESISVQKYPLYKVYQQTTSQCIPWLFSSNGRKILKKALEDEERKKE